MPQVNELDMHSGINMKEENALRELSKQVAHPGAVYVEVGSWKGHSASILAEVAKEFGGHVYCVDHWKGSEDTALVSEAKGKDIYSLFTSNLVTLELWNYVTPMKMDSLTASEKFADDSIDFLFIDADHRYQQFMTDLEAWSLKVKKGGIICGHDCERKFSSAPPELKDRLNRNLDIDFDGNFHAGVIKGLFDYFNDEFHIVPDTRIWLKVIESE